MTEHTPGPWWFAQEEVGYAVGSADRELAFVVQCGTYSEGAGRANARLIAAAPDMLAALRDLLEWGRENTSPRDNNSPHNLLIAAAAAIAKAEGAVR